MISTPLHLTRSATDLHARVSSLEQLLSAAQLSDDARGLLLALHGMWDNHKRRPVPLAWLEDYFRQATILQLLDGVDELKAVGLVREIGSTQTYLPTLDHGLPWPHSRGRA